MPAVDPQQRYRQLLELIGSEVDRNHPGVFDWRFDQPSASVVRGLIITKADRPGYVFVVGVTREGYSTQGGIWKPDADFFYSGSILAKRDWEHPQRLRGENYLESRCSEDASNIVEWIVNDWAYERPWQAPPPIDSKAEKRRLQKIATGLSEREPIPVIVEASPSQHNLTPQAADNLTADLAGLQPEPLAHYSPYDKQGRLAVKSSVLLSRYPTTSPLPQSRELCLVAVGPLRRRDEQQIRITLETLIPPNQDHNWEDQRWRWHSDTPHADPQVRWGTPLEADDLTKRTPTTTILEKTAQKHQLKAHERALLAICWQDAGQLIEAFELFDVGIDDNLRRLLGGQKIYPPAMCAYADEKWTQRLIAWMRAAAPWLLPPAMQSESARIAEWAAEKKSRRRRPPLLKLFSFPGQHHSRKACLMLTAEVDGTHPRLILHATASNARLHESAWKRPLEMDLLRYGLPQIYSTSTDC